MIGQLQRVGMGAGVEPLHRHIQVVGVQRIEKIPSRRAPPHLPLQFDVLVDIGRGESGRADAEEILGIAFVIDQLWPRHIHELHTDAENAIVVHVRHHPGPRTTEADIGRIAARLTEHAHP